MRKLNANQWVLVVVVVLLVAIGIDLTRKVLMGDNASAAPPRKEDSILVGQAAPDFTLPDEKGKDRTLASLVKGPTLLTFSCGCSSCRQMEGYLGKLQKTKGSGFPAVITVSSADPASYKAWKRDTSLKGLMLYDRSEATEIIQMYNGHPCPRLYLMDGDRQVTWRSVSLSDFEMPEIGLEEMSRTAALELGFSDPNEPQPGKPPAPSMVIAPSVPAPGGSGERLYEVSTDPNDPLPAGLVRDMKKNRGRRGKPATPPPAGLMAPYAGTSNASPYDPPPGQVDKAPGPPGAQP